MSELLGSNPRGGEEASCWELARRKPLWTGDDASSCCCGQGLVVSYYHHVAVVRGWRSAIIIMLLWPVLGGQLRTRPLEGTFRGAFGKNTVHRIYAFIPVFHRALLLSYSCNVMRELSGLQDATEHFCSTTNLTPFVSGHRRPGVNAHWYKHAAPSRSCSILHRKNQQS